MQTFAFMSRNGGVGKSTISMHLAGALAGRGLRTVLLDLDPRMSLSYRMVGWELADRLEEDETILGPILGREPKLDKLVRRTYLNGAWLVPSSRDLEAAADFRYLKGPNPGSEFAVCDLLCRLEGSFDAAILDCGMGAGLGAWMASIAGAGMVVAFLPWTREVPGLEEIQEFLAAAGAAGHPGRLLGHLASKTSHYRSQQENLAAVRDELGDAVFETTIPETAAYASAHYGRRPVGRLSPRSKAAIAMEALADELFDRLTAASEGEVSPAAA